ncbi:MAG: 4Fe-4S dicluster domain-containing protein, partial [Clostridia bacterium]|jgi:heterodisulfide reductase subunit C|nr:4Fe-4S dicluster domain-containing protein [Clostridia bacterium]
VFDNDASGIASKANTDSFEEKMFHIIRAFHVAGRCTDCGECTRVCPQGIPLHLFNRKYIKDINEFYGEYAAGAEAGQRGPLINYTLEDIDPAAVSDKGGN